MLTREDDVDAPALHARGWTISAIARHLGHDRKTIRAYLAGGRVAGERARSGDGAFDPFVAYVTERLREDPHLWAMTLFDELTALRVQPGGHGLPIHRRAGASRSEDRQHKPAVGDPISRRRRPIMGALGGRVR